MSEVASVNILGFEFQSTTPDENVIEQTYTKYIDKMIARCKSWESRRLPLKGKIVILNSLNFPMIYYVASNSFCPEWVISKVCKVASDFLWYGATPKISKKKNVLPVAEGGLGLHDFAFRIFASTIMWIKRIVLFGQDFWTDYLKFSFGVNEILHIPLRKCHTLVPGLPPFYKSVLETWQNFYCLS